MGVMAEKARIKLPLPEAYMDLIDRSKEGRGWSDRRLAKEAGVSNAAITRLRKGLASWETVVFVAKVLDLPLPVLVLPGSEADKLNTLASKDPERYKIVLSLLKEK